MNKKIFNLNFLLILIIIILLAFIWVIYYKNNGNFSNNSNIIVGSNDNQKPVFLPWKQDSFTWTNINTWVYTKEVLSNKDLTSLKIPKDYKLGDDLNNFESVFNWVRWNTDEFFYKIWRQNLYLDWNDVEISKLISCVNAKSDKSSLSWISLKICDWKNIFDKQDNTNYYMIKYQLINFPKILNNNSFDCWVFTKNMFNYPENDEIEDENNKLNNKLNNYFICNKLKNNKYDFVRNSYNFRVALESNKCEILEDKSLEKLCIEGLKNYSKTLWIK